MLQHSSPQFAPVAPIHILEGLLNTDPRNLFGAYHLFLAHHTAEYADRFTNLWTKYFNSPIYTQPTVIMDNSIVELGGAVDDQMIRTAVEAVRQGLWRASIIPVLPDVMGSGVDTLDLSEEAYARWVSSNMPGNGFMLVTQGLFWIDFTNLVDYFFIHNREKFKKITWVGIPRRLEAAGIPRAKAVKYITAVAPWLNIHLLGFSNSIESDLEAVRLDLPQIKGIDSAVPVRFNGMLTPTTRDGEIGPRGSWWEKGTLGSENVRNILNVRKWVS